MEATTVASALFAQRHAEEIGQAAEYGSDSLQDALLSAWQTIVLRLESCNSDSAIAELVVSVDLRTDQGYLKRGKRQARELIEHLPAELVDCLDSDDRSLITLAAAGLSTGEIAHALNWPVHYCSDLEVWRVVDKLVLMAWLRMCVMDVVESLYSLSIFTSIRAPKSLYVSEAEAGTLAKVSLDALTIDAINVSEVIA